MALEELLRVGMNASLEILKPTLAGCRLAVQCIGGVYEDEQLARSR